MASEPSNPDLESFRQQWLSDLRSREAHPEQSQGPSAASTSSAVQPSSPTGRRYTTKPSSSTSARPAPSHHLDDVDDYVPGRTFDEPPHTQGHVLSELTPAVTSERSEPVSALDHYEEAMEKEAQGNMGDSLHLYRKAYKLDHGVDRRYREKYFPAAGSSQTKTSSHATSTATALTSATPTGAPRDPKEAAQMSSTLASTPQARPDASSSPPKSLTALITSFASLRIEPLAPEVEGAPSPPCPISALPDELLTHILRDVAISDVADFMRLAHVCKHLAYLVSTERRIWQRICLGEEVGFTAMHHDWQLPIDWTTGADADAVIPAPEDFASEDGEVEVPLSKEQVRERARLEKIALSKSLVPAPYTTYQSMFRNRPRLRFNGCYISTVNYIRTGQASTNQATWGSAPVLIVTYYRYLRFLRDGSCISLLTTDDPGSVVHHLTPEMLNYHRDNSQGGHLPSAVMSQALKGRWRLVLPSSAAAPGSGPGSVPTTGVPSGDGNSGPGVGEGDIEIETEGVVPKYKYHMDLSLRSAGKAAARNNKIVWRGFYSYNRLTDDWGEFTLKHDKPFFFSRVKSYGAGL